MLLLAPIITFAPKKEVEFIIQGQSDLATDINLFRNKSDCGSKFLREYNFRFLVEIIESV